MHRVLQPRWQAHFHAVMTVFWVILVVPAMIWWKESILYVILISQWANVAAHWSGYQGAHSELRTKDMQESSGADPQPA